MRVDKDHYFMGIARQVASRATCPRRHVGAVLVVNDHIVSTGYNGAPAGLPHCLDEGCEMVNGHCVRPIHAEENALIHSNGVSIAGGTLYTTASPCRHCMGLIINAGIRRVVYADRYTDSTHKDDQSSWSLKAAAVVGIEMKWLED